MRAPVASSPLSSNLSTASRARTRAVPPPGTMPSSMAARVAERASSMRWLLLLQLDLGGRADTDDGHAAGQFGQPLLELLPVPVRGGVLDLPADLAMRRWTSSVSPPPSTMVVSSLVMVTRRARPSWSSVTFSSLARLGRKQGGAVRMARSTMVLRRRSPKPGALTAAELNVPRSLLTTRLASASPSTSSAMICSGLWPA